jgi:hypothetical protein
MNYRVLTGLYTHHDDTYDEPSPQDRDLTGLHEALQEHRNMIQIIMKDQDSRQRQTFPEW